MCVNLYDTTNLLKRPWDKYSNRKPWMDDKPDFGTTRYNTPDYHTRRWRNARTRYLNEHPLCVMCERIGKVTAATVIDHRISIANGGEFWDEDNWQGLCTKCHRIKTNKEISIRNQR